MKKLSKIVSLMLSLALCLGMASPAFAASFDDLQDAIEADFSVPTESTDEHANGTKISDENGGTYGYAWTDKTEGTEGFWGIHAWDDDETGRNVQLNEDVKHNAEDETKTITVGEDQNVNLDLNDQNIIGNGENTVIDVKEGGELTITGKDESTPEDGTHNTISNKPSESTEPAENANGIDVEGSLAMDGVTITDTDTAVNVKEGGTAEIEDSTITGNRTGVKFVDDSSVTFINNQNVVTNNTSKNISGNGKVNFKLGKTTYKVDAETAETLLADKDSIAAHGEDWILTTNGTEGTYTVIYTGTGKTVSTGSGPKSALTKDMVNKIMRAASSEDKKVITGFVISEGVQRLHDGAFSASKNLAHVTIPASVLDISHNVFHNCLNLKSVVFAEGSKLGWIGDEAFFGCTGLTEVTIPGGIIGTEAFYGCTNLTNVELQEGVKFIGKGAFRACPKLNSISIPETVTTIVKLAFWGSESLTTITIPTSVSSMSDDWVFYQSGIKSILISRVEGENMEENFSNLLKALLSPISKADANIYAEKDEGNLSFYRGVISADFNHDSTDVGIDEIDGSVKLTNVSGPITVGGIMVTLPSVEGITASIDTDGNISVHIPGTVEHEEYPDDAAIHPDGSAVLPAGAVMTDKDGSKIDLPHGGQIHADGTYTVNPHRYTNQVTKEAACTEDGERADVCSCGDKQNAEQISATGHRYGDGVVTRKPACTDDGEMTYTCVKGDHSYTEAIPAKGHGEGVWTVTTPARPGVPGVESLICPGCGEVLDTREIPALPAPAIPDDGGADAAPDAATIADQEVPLAGLMPLYMLLEELRQHEEIPEIELPEDFKWIEHAYAQAIYWGLQEELVVDTEEEPLDPDEVLTVGRMREVLVNFVERYLGLDDFVVTLEGEDDEIVMDLGARLTAFYAELDAALKAQEDKAA